LHANDGDFTHPIFLILTGFTSSLPQRLADLIQIRAEDVTRNDVINIVAHSQGTIITMLANMLVKQAGYGLTASFSITPLTRSKVGWLKIFNQVIIRHPMRGCTFKNFCALMATHYKGGEITKPIFWQWKRPARCVNRPTTR
jgi:hypothetical protein